MSKEAQSWVSDETQRCEGVERAIIGRHLHITAKKGQIYWSNFLPKIAILKPLNIFGTSFFFLMNFKSTKTKD